MLLFVGFALAWQTDQTRIASYMLAKEISMRTYNMLGISDAFHPLSHHQDDPVKLERLTKIQTYHTERFAKFIKRIAAMKEGESTVLDQSIILFGSNMSNSNLHDHFPLPTAIVGGGCGKVKGNQHLRYPDRTPIANMHVALLNRVGISTEKFGDSTGEFKEI